MGLAELPQITQFLTGVAQAGFVVDETALMGDICAVAPDADTLNPDQRRGAFADIAAFRFQRSLWPTRKCWGGYWGPLTSWVTDTGEEFYDPDVADIDDEIIKHWIRRSETLTHPVLRARYADLAWDFGKVLKRPLPGFMPKHEISINVSVKLACRAIDAYLDIVERNLQKDEYHAWQFIDRAISLAAQINDLERLATGKLALFSFYSELDRNGGKFMWWRFDDIARDHAKSLCLSATEKLLIIVALEKALATASNASDPLNFNPHDALSAADRISVRRTQSTEDLAESKCAMQTAAFAMEAAAKMASGLTAISMLEGLISRYRNAGLSGEAARVEREIRDRADSASAEMKRVSVPVEVSREEMDQWSDSFISGTLSEGIGYVAHACLIKEDSSREQLHELARDAPLWAQLSTSIMGANGLTAAIVGPIKDDIEGRSIQHAADLMGWHAPWLYYGLNRIRKAFDLDAEKFLAVLRECEFFKSEREGLLVEGLCAWLSGDHIKAIHVLVPQVEAALRDLLSALGAPVAEPDKINGGFMMIGMGKILNHAFFVNGVSKDVRFHLRALYSDARGINLRNNLAHGLAHSGLLGAGASNWVIHSIMMIGKLRLQERT